VSDCCLKPQEQVFSYTMTRTSYIAYEMIISAL